MGSLIIIAAMFLLLWLLLIRPQRQRQAAHQRMLETVEVGDEILTNGGIFGVVTYVDEEENELHVEIAENVRVRLDRRGVSAVVSGDEDEEEELDEAAEPLEGGGGLAPRGELEQPEPEQEPARAGRTDSTPT